MLVVVCFLVRIMLMVVRTVLFAVIVRSHRMGALGVFVSVPVQMAVLMGMFVSMSHTIMRVFVGVTMLVNMIVLM